MGLGFGLLSAQLRPGETDWTRAYDETIRLAVEAERLGFDVGLDHRAPLRRRRLHALAAGRLRGHRTGDVADRHRHGRHPGAAPPPATPRRGRGDRAAPEPRAPPRSAWAWAGPRRSSRGWGPTSADAAPRWTRSCRSCRRRGRASRSRTRVRSTPSRPWASGRRRRHGSRCSSAGERRRPSGAPPASRTASSPTSPADAFVQQVRWVLDECERIGRDPGHLPLRPLLGPAAGRVARRRHGAATATRSGRCSGSTTTWRRRQRARCRSRPRPAHPLRRRADPRAGDLRRPPRRAGRGAARSATTGRRPRRAGRAEPLPAARVRGAGGPDGPAGRGASRRTSEAPGDWQT